MDLAFARAQMGLSLAFHIVFAIVGIGLPVLMVVAEALWLRTGPPSAGSAFAFRKYDRRDDATHRRWSTLFGAASTLTPFFPGLSLSGLGTGEIRVVGGHVITGFLARWTSPFALGCGVLA
jgi:cytochrome bd-type quinol oxidase subunit 2